jgi:hypothetical protein
MSEQLTALFPHFIFCADDKHEYRLNTVRYNLLITFYGVSVYLFSHKYKTDSPVTLLPWASVQLA